MRRVETASVKSSVSKSSFFNYQMLQGGKQVDPKQKRQSVQQPLIYNDDHPSILMRKNLSPLAKNTYGALLVEPMQNIIHEQLYYSQEGHLSSSNWSSVMSPNEKRTITQFYEELEKNISEEKKANSIKRSARKAMGE